MFSRNILIAIGVMVALGAGVVLVDRYVTLAGPPEVPLNFEEYQGKDDVYSVWFPAGWTINDTRVEQPADVLTNPSFRVVMAFYPTTHDAAGSKAGRKELMKMTERDFRADELHTVEDVRKLRLAGRQAQVVSGKYFDDPEYWLFENYTVFLPENGVFTITVNVLEQHDKRYRETIEAIVGSVRF